VRRPRSSDSDFFPTVAQTDLLRDELARERVRSERAIACGARLLARIDELERLLREYGAHHPDCVYVDAAPGSATCSCGLHGHLRDVETWRVEMTMPTQPSTITDSVQLAESG
jgi:hypothetical protein